MMHDPKLIDAIGNAYDLEEQAISVDEWNMDPAASRTRCATAALTALCTLRPDVAAVLRGEAVAVPREATQGMIEAGRNRLYREDDGDPEPMDWNTELTWSAMLAASPYATKETP